MLGLLASGRIAHKNGKVPLLKRYLDEMKGKPLQDVWTDLTQRYQKKERFPTQKPEALLERIINASTNPQQVVYEAFSGSATAGAVCHKLSRKWIGSEISESACRFSLERLQELGCNVKFYTKLCPVLEVQIRPSPKVSQFSELKNV